MAVQGRCVRVLWGGCTAVRQGCAPVWCSLVVVVAFLPAAPVCWLGYGVGLSLISYWSIWVAPVRGGTYFSLPAAKKSRQKKAGSNRQPVGVHLWRKAAVVRDKMCCRTSRVRDEALIHPVSTLRVPRLGSLWSRYISVMCNGVAANARYPCCMEHSFPSSEEKWWRVDEVPSLSTIAGCQLRRSGTLPSANANANANAKRQTPNAKRQTPNAKRRTANDATGACQNLSPDAAGSACVNPFSGRPDPQRHRLHAMHDRAQLQPAVGQRALQRLHRARDGSNQHHARCHA
jgi:hypothetical protein